MSEYLWHLPDKLTEFPNFTWYLREKCPNFTRQKCPKNIFPIFGREGAGWCTCSSCPPSPLPPSPPPLSPVYIYRHITLSFYISMIFVRGAFVRGGLLPGGGAFVRGAYARSPQVQCVYEPSRLSVPSIVAWRTNKQKKQKDKLGPVAPRGVDPRSPNFQGM